MENSVLITHSSEFEARYRKNHGVTLEELCYGLVSTSQVSSWENGNATIDFAICYRLFSRLFIEESSSTWKVNNDEYAIWRKQNNIVWLLCTQKYDEALIAIDSYASEEGLKPLEEQFILRMRAVYLMATDGNRDEIYRLTKEALLITVPEFSTDKLVKLILSSCELDMVIDIERYSSNNRRVYGAVIGYLISREIKEPYQRRILPKATYYYIDTIDIGSIMDLHQIFILKGKIDYAIECLRNTGYLNYMLELLGKKKEIVERQMALDVDNGEKYSEEIKIVEEYIKIFSGEYERFGIRKDTIIIPDTYVPCSVYNMSEVVYKRRTMLGISQSALARDLCDIKTIRRWEQGKTVPQEYIRNIVFERLRMRKTGLLYEQSLLSYFMGGMLAYDATAEKSWNDIRYKASYVNDLVLPEEDSGNEYNDKFLYEEVNPEYWTETFDDIKGRIEERYPINTIIEDKVKWIDRVELLDYYNFSLLIDNQKERMRYVTAMRNYLAENDGTDLEMSEWVEREYTYNLIRNEYGNSARYEESNAIADYIFKSQLCYRRFHLNAQLLYNNWWNENEKLRKSGKVPNNTEQVLRQCILIAKLLKSARSTEFYEWKLETIQKENS